MPNEGGGSFTVTIKRTYSGVEMISTSRYPACLMVSAVCKSSAFVMQTSFMCENVVGPIRPALEQFADETANLPGHRFRAPLVRLPTFSGVGFLFTSFSQAFKGGHFTRPETFCQCIGRGTQLLRNRCPIEIAPLLQS